MALRRKNVSSLRSSSARVSPNRKCVDAFSNSLRETPAPVASDVQEVELTARDPAAGNRALELLGYYQNIQQKHLLGSPMRFPIAAPSAFHIATHG
jgi:hypothetical protein